MNALLCFGCHAILIVGQTVFFLVRFKISDPTAIIPGQPNALPGYTVKHPVCLRHMNPMMIMAVQVSNIITTMP